MEEIFKIAGAIILSFGGSSVILVGLSGWLGKIWANRILENQKKEIAIEIEKYKNNLTKEINLINSKLDKSNYITKIQYDKEFSIYLEIWEKLSSCVISTKALYPIIEDVPVEEDEIKKLNERKWATFVQHYNDFANAIIKYSPFYEEKLYEGFIELRRLCHKQGKMFKTYEFDVKYSISFAAARDTRMTPEQLKEVYSETPNKIDVLQNKLQKEIRNHLTNLKAI